MSAELFFSELRQIFGEINVKHIDDRYDYKVHVSGTSSWAIIILYQLGVKINEMCVSFDQRGQGIGSRFLDDIKLAAQRALVTIRLYPTPLRGTEGDKNATRENLFKFYRRAGFEPMHGNEDKDDWIWKPLTKKRTPQFNSSCCLVELSDFTTFHEEGEFLVLGDSVNTSEVSQLSEPISTPIVLEVSRRYKGMRISANQKSLLIALLQDGYTHWYIDVRTKMEVPTVGSTGVPLAKNNHLFHLLAETPPACAVLDVNCCRHNHSKKLLSDEFIDDYVTWDAAGHRKPISASVFIVYYLFRRWNWENIFGKYRSPAQMKALCTKVTLKDRNSLKKWLDRV